MYSSSHVEKYKLNDEMSNKIHTTVLVKIHIKISSYVRTKL